MSNEKKKGPSEIIKNKIQFILKTKENWLRKTAWKEMLQFPDIRERVSDVVTNIKAMVVEEAKRFKEKTSSKESWIFRKKTFLGEKRIAKNKDGKSTEVALERLFTAFSEDLYNQYNILSGVVDINQTAQSIDIVKAPNKKIEEMIELKTWDNENDHPLAAAIEVLMNYYFCEAIISKGIQNEAGRRPRLADSVTLTVLAPTGYFAHHLKTEKSKLKVIEDAINGVLKGETRRKVKFSFEALDSSFNLKHFIELVKEIERLQGSFSKRSKVKTS